MPSLNTARARLVAGLASLTFSAMFLAIAILPAMPTAPGAVLIA